MKRKSTMIEFVEELKKLPKSNEIEFMIDEAVVGEYHDYKNEKYICGKAEASRKLRLLGYIPLALRIESGEFDEEADESDKALLKRDAMAGGFSEEMCKKLFGI